jgi:type I restriction enzyme S subunit
MGYLNSKEVGFYIHNKFGEVPIGWEVIELGKCFEFFPTACYSRSILSENGDCAYIHYGDIHTKFHRFIDLERDKLPYVSNELATRFTKIEEGDLVIADASEDYEGVGKAVEIKNVDGKHIISGLHTLHLRTKNGCFVNGFKGYLLNHQIVRLNILRSATGFKVYSVSKSGLQKILLPKPPINEQIAITNILSKVDEATETIHKSIKASEKLKKALMQNLLTGKLKPNGTWRKEEEYYFDEKYGKVPVGWIGDKVKNLAIRVTDGEHISPDFQDSGPYLLSAEDIFDDGISFNKAKHIRPEDFNKFRIRCNPELGDVLIVSRGASIGRTCKVNVETEFCLMGSVILIKPNEEKLIGSFLSLYFKSYKAWVELQRLSGTTAQQAIYLTHIKKVKMTYPENLVEQKLIADKLDAIYTEISNKQTKIQRLQRLKKSLMQNLLTGKVRLSEELINQLTEKEDLAAVY